MVVAVATLSNRDAQAQASPNASRVPVFEVDPAWPKLPNSWVVGHVASVAVDRRDHVWMLHRPNTIPEDRRSHAAPPVLEFDASGKFVNAWGGPGNGYDWPDSEHGIAVDYKDRVWIGGSAPVAPSLRNLDDDMLLKFDNKGKFLLQIGGRTASKGNADTKTVHQSADVFVWPKTNEAFVADGYGNRRVIVFDADTGAFKRMWGAFGNAPVDVPAAPRGGGAGGANAGGGRGAAAALDTEGNGSQQFGGPVHAVKVSNDGLVYVADRPNRRVQVFTPDGKYVTQAFINRSGPSPQSAAGLAFSPDAQQQFLYVADYGNSHIAVLDRKSLQAPLSVRTAQREAGRLPGPASPGDRFQGQSLHRRGRAGRARAAIRVQGTLEHAAAQRASRPAVAPRSERCAAHVSGSGAGARRLSAVDQHDGKSVPRHSQLAATGGHQARRRDRHHPGRQGRHVAASPIGTADSAHRRVG